MTLWQIFQNVCVVLVILVFVAAWCVLIGWLGSKLDDYIEKALLVAPEDNSVLRPNPNRRSSQDVV